MRRRLGVAAGVVLLAVAVGFCVATFRREHERVADALAGARVGWLVVAVVVAAAAMAWLALGWRRCLAVLGETRPRVTVARWYFLGELGKYVPGGIWPVLGRGELARRGGVARSTAYQSVVLSLAAWYGAAALPVAAVAAHPQVQASAARLLRRASGGRVTLAELSWATLVRVVASYLPVWLLIGFTTSAITWAYDGAPGWQAPVAAVLAWTAGFVAVPVPAGAGVREAVFIATSGLPAGLGLTVAVTARLAYITVDLAGAGIAAFTGRRPWHDGEP